MKAYLGFVWVYALLFPLTGCSQEPGEWTVSELTAVTYNYSDEVIVSVRVDGELAGTGMEAAKPGGVTSSGRSCCISMDAAAKTLPVEIKPALADQYVVEGEVEQPWPKGASTAIVHVLPGRKVVVETTLGYGIGPRKDLMDGQLAAMGITKEVEYSGPINAGRHTYTEYMEVDLDD